MDVINKLHVGGIEVWENSDGTFDIFSTRALKILPLAVNHIKIYISPAVIPTPKEVNDA